MESKYSNYLNTITGTISFEDALIKYKSVLPNEHLYVNFSSFCCQESFT